MNKWKRIRPYIAFSAIALAVGGASSFATRAGMADFDLLTKPPAAPPDWLFPIAWTILYLLMGITMGLVWRSSTAARAGKPPRSGASSWLSTACGRCCFSCWARTGRRFSGSWG